MTLEVFRDMQQRGEEWRAARLGIVTASLVGRLLTPTLKVADNESSRGVVAALAAERITRTADPERMSADMWRGVEEEPLARDAYSEHHAPVVECGLMIRHHEGFRVGYSPDGLVGDVGLIEIKSRLQKVQMLTILGDDTLTAAMPQLQAALWVSGRHWIDYVSYCGGMPLWVRRVTPDPAWQHAITAACAATEERIALTTRIYTQAVAGLPVMPPRIDLSEIEV